MYRAGILYVHIYILESSGRPYGAASILFRSEAPAPDFQKQCAGIGKGLTSANASPVLWARMSGGPAGLNVLGRAM